MIKQPAPVDSRESHRALRDEAGAAAFWHGMLSAVTLPTPLVVTRAVPNPPGAGALRATCAAVLGSDVARSLRERAHAIGVPLDTVVAAAWALLLCRYSGETDVVFGVAPDGAATSADWLPLRIRVEPQRPIADWLRDQDAALRAFDTFRWSSLAQVRAHTEASDAVLFESAVRIVTEGTDGRLPAPPGVALAIDVCVSDALTLTLTFDGSRVDEQTAARTLGHLETLLCGIAQNPEGAVCDLPLLTAQERVEILEKWNSTAGDFSRHRCVHELFAEQAARTPDAVAVEFGDEQLTYRELDTQANQFAHHLRRLGVGPDVFVGVCVERSARMVVALYGILKAGGAYIPIDPTYPAERIVHVLQDAQAALLVTEQALLATLDSASARTVCIDRDWEIIGREPVEPPAPLATADHAAYMIYTSGSTGRPKGVQIGHRALVNFLESMQRTPGMAASDVLLAVTTVAFDIAGLELHLPLITGARVAIVPWETSAEGPALMRALERHNATMMQATPATWRLLLNAGWTGHQKLKLLCGGEAMPADLARALIPRCGELWNMYGPTETTVWSTCCRVSDPDDIHIGKPIANTDVYILDAQQQPVPIGVPGELFIGGEGLARGYWNRAELNDEKFVPHPFKPGQRLYRTGDLARFRVDGNVSCLGRLDSQVKVRGFRIELGEIEEVLKEHPSVRDAALTVWSDSSGNQRLVAYVVHSAGVSMGGDADSASEDAPVSQWQRLYDEIYRTATPDEEAAGTFVGWNSSYTGGAKTDEEMGAWLNDVAERLLALRPRQVLEIGCGHGQLLFKVAQHCTRYVALDFSAVAVDTVNRQMAQRGSSYSHVEAMKLSADQIDRFVPGSFDTVVINSVAQYFPGSDYLYSVLEKATRLVKDGGHILVADVRNLLLLEELRASVLFFRAPGALSREDARERLRRDCAQEKELLVAPDFFHSLRARMPRVSGAEVHLKRGPLHDELVRFRYDVILHVGGAREIPPVPEWLDWNDDGLDINGLTGRLREGPATLAIRGVPNRRVIADVRLCELLKTHNGPESAAQLRDEAAKTSADAVDPEDLWNLGKTLGYRVDIGWPANNAPAFFEVVFTALGRAASPFVSSLADRRIPARSMHQFTNVPAQPVANSPLAPDLRRHAGAKLPDYMVPSLYIALEKLPLTPNGKIDRKALPAPSRARPRIAQALAEPETELQRSMVQLWQEVLQIDRIGIDDPFFEIGANSLHVAEVHLRLSKLAGRGLPITALFQFTTVRTLADHLSSTASPTARTTAVQDRASRQRQALFGHRPARG